METSEQLSPNWVNLIDQNVEILVKALTNSLQKLIDSYPLGESSKEALKYIAISFLRTSLFDQSPLYRIDFYDHNNYLDFVEHFEYFDISFISNLLYTHYNEVIIELRQWSKYKEICGLEEEIRKSAEELHHDMKSKIKDILSEVLKSLDLRDNRFVAVSFGDYLNDYDFIDTIGGK